MKKQIWKPLEEIAGHKPTEPRVLFSRQPKGRQRLYFNQPALAILGLESGNRVTFLFAAAEVRPVLGMNPATAPEGAELRGYKSSKSLIVTTGAIDHLKKAYKKICYRPRLGITADGEPAMVLEPMSSEKEPLP